MIVDNALSQLAFKAFGSEPLALGEWLQLHPPNEVKAAILAAQGKTWRYAEAILQRRAAAGYPKESVRETRKEQERLAFEEREVRRKAAEEARRRATRELEARVTDETRQTGFAMLRKAAEKAGLTKMQAHERR